MRQVLEIEQSQFDPIVQGRNDLLRPGLLQFCSESSNYSDSWYISEIGILFNEEIPCFQSHLKGYIVTSFSIHPEAVRVYDLVLFFKFPFRTYRTHPTDTGYLESLAYSITDPLWESNMSDRTYLPWKRDERIAGWNDIYYICGTGKIR